MSLAEFQRALGDLIASPLHSAEVAAQPQRALHDYALTQRERRRLWVMARSSA